MYKKLCFLIASFFGVGYAPKASGTFGSLAALPLCWYLLRYHSLDALYIAIALVFIIGWIATRKVLKYTKPDPSLVVIDEVAGQLTSFTLPLYYGLANAQWLCLLGGFILFRFFDIVKIWPASYFDKKVHNAFGVMADDIVAGIYAAATLTLFLHVLG
ncbi:MAG: phosphatidylglycerophosphatase A [Alphaproteobacteria bacterium]|nr:phosphatidylglycerophosphatase A [Alphaproteobacteria bacterium]